LTPPITLGIDARVKAGGAALKSRAQELTAVYEPGAEELGDYERLLTDAMRGDSTLFAREDIVEVAWSIVDPILGDATPVHEYSPGTWGPREADMMTEAVGGWKNPSEA
jgi:glucose-6-phosphate 1-dehydrogenase